MAKINSESKEKFPSEPWRWRDDWETAAIVTSRKKSMFGFLFIALAWNALAWPLTVLLLADELRSENYLALLILFFPIVGLLLCAMAFRCGQRYFKYGESRFRLASNPGVIGGALSGVVESSRPLRATKGFRVQLSCISREVHGSGKNRSVRQNVLWQSMQTVRRDLGVVGKTSVIPIHFAVPFDEKASSEDAGAENRIYWKLEMKSDEPGINYEANFEVPVFRTEASDPNFQLDQQLVEEFTHVPCIEEIYEEARLVRHETQHGVELKSPPFRDAKNAIGATVFTLVWAGATALLWYATRDGGGLSVIIAIFLGLFVLFGVLLLFMTIDLWLWHSHIQVTQQGIESRTGLLGFARTRWLRANQIKPLEFKKSMQSGMTIFYDISLETNDGKKYSIVRRITNEAATRRIIQDIESRLGFTSEPQETLVPSLPSLATAAGEK